MKYIKKSCNIFFWILDKINKKLYKKLYPCYLSWLGININKNDYDKTWISPTVFFDSSRYNMIEIGKNVTISFDVTVLVHDYSIVHAAGYIGKKAEKIIVKKVVIGNNVFIGAKTTILPGTTIGDNCIIGAGSVIKGCLEANSVYCGNPAKRICTIQEYAEKYSDLLI